MHPQIRTTVFGQVVRSLSSHASFRYPDESDPSLSQALIQDDTASGVTPLKELSDGTKSQGPPEGHLANGSPAKTGQKEIHLVSWYGPDDPEVSKYAISCYGYASLTKASCRTLKIGHKTGNCWLRPNYAFSIFASILPALYTSPESWESWKSLMSVRLSQL